MSKQTLYHNGLLGWPQEWTERNYNGCNEPCDMLIGPCACGAWHHAEDWDDALRYYNAEIQYKPDIRTQEPLTLSYF